MKRAYASAFAAKGKNDTSTGYKAFGDEVLGPYNLVTSPEAQFVAGEM